MLYHFDFYKLFSFTAFLSLPDKTTKHILLYITASIQIIIYYTFTLIERKPKQTPPAVLYSVPFLAPQANHLLSRTAKRERHQSFNRHKLSYNILALNGQDWDLGYIVSTSQ